MFCLCLFVGLGWVFFFEEIKSRVVNTLERPNGGKKSCHSFPPLCYVFLSTNNNSSFGCTQSKEFSTSKKIMKYIA